MKRFKTQHGWDLSAIAAHYGARSRATTCTKRDQAVLELDNGLEISFDTVDHRVIVNSNGSHTHYYGITRNLVFLQRKLRKWGRRVSRERVRALLERICLMEEV